MRRVWTSPGFQANSAQADAQGQIGGYRVLSTLGEGAASVVYEVQDLADGRLYALKVIKKKSEDDQRYFDQGDNEHQIAQRLDHPLLRKSYRLIRQRELLRVSEVHLLMELVEGTTLNLRRPRSRRAMIGLFQAVARGLGAMHAAGLVHADIKPINILLTRQGGLKIIDFGQSCPINTVKPRIQGTLDYIAPEQILRKAITPRTDAYNLGATMYWCVTDTHAPSVVRQRRVGEPVTPEDDARLKDPREFNADLPPALALLILDCLKPHPSDRPASMREIEERLATAVFQIKNAAKRAVAGAV